MLFEFLEANSAFLDLILFIIHFLYSFIDDPLLAIFTVQCLAELMSGCLLNSVTKTKVDVRSLLLSHWPVPIPSFRPAIGQERMRAMNPLMTSEAERPRLV